MTGLQKLIYIETYITIIKMNSCQLTHAIKQNHVMSHIFLVIFPRDIIPKHRDNSSIIANTDTSDEVGMHLVAMCKQNSTCGFFDCYETNFR